MGVVKLVRHRDRQISKDLQADLAQAKPETCRRARSTALCGYAARTSAIAQNPFRGNNYPGQCHTTPTGVKTQWRATRCRSSLGKSLHGKDLRPDRQHTDEQRQRRQRGGFFDHGPNHDPFLPTGQNENDVLFLFQSQARELSGAVLFQPEIFEGVLIPGWQRPNLRSVNYVARH